MNRFLRIMSLLSLLLLCFTACEYEGPDAVWQDNPQGDTAPEITSVEPAGIASAGATKIRILGNNFSSVFEENFVYFDNVQVDVYTSSESELLVYRPNLVAEDITISVVTRRALEDAKFTNYAVSDIGSQLYTMRELGTLNTMIVDENENMFIHSNRKTYLQVSKEAGFVQLMTTLPRVVYDLKMGPGGVVYVGRDEKYLMVVRPDGTEFEKWANGLPQKVKYLDFDENLNIYAGGKRSGILKIGLDESVVSLGGYENHDIAGVRVYNGELYVAASYLGDDGLDLAFGIYKHTINADGTLGERTVFVDWSKTGGFVETTFSDFEFDEDGILLVSTNGGEGFNLDPMMMVYPDGTVDTFYKGGILSGPILGMAWGSGETLYYFKTDSDGLIFTIHEMGMAKRCAPRYGRQS